MMSITENFKKKKKMPLFRTIFFFFIDWEVLFILPRTVLFIRYFSKCCEIKSTNCLVACGFRNKAMFSLIIFNFCGSCNN